MILKITGYSLNRLLFWIAVVSFCFGQEPDSTDTNSVIHQLAIAELPAGDQVKNSGRILISEPEGFTRIVGETVGKDSVLVIAVHGYDSRGYEWIYPLTRLTERFNLVFFFRYDWELCPDEVAHILNLELLRLLKSFPGTKKLILFSHSYGGLVVTNLAAAIDMEIPVEIHTVAAPLAGYPGLTDRCNNMKMLPVYTPWKVNVTHVQWRTRHEQDNAFNKLDIDPQVVDLQDSEVILLPATMDNHRLGHNWSISWVIDKYLNQ